MFGALERFRPRAHTAGRAPLPLEQPVPAGIGSVLIAATGAAALGCRYYASGFDRRSSPLENCQPGSSLNASRPAVGSDRANLARARTLVAALDVEAHPLLRGQRLESQGAAQRRAMEEVLLSILAGDEPETAFRDDLLTVPSIASLHSSCEYDLPQRSFAKEMATTSDAPRRSRHSLAYARDADGDRGRRP